MIDKNDAEVVTRMLDEWDPIGVYDGSVEPPPGEYERLAWPVLSMLQAGADATTIAAYLTSDVRTNMGLPSRPYADLDIATRLHSWFHNPAR